MGLIPRGGGTGASTDDDKKCCCVCHCCPCCCCCDNDVDLPPEEEEVVNGGVGAHNRLQGLQGGTAADRFHMDRYHSDTLLKLSTSFINGVEYLMFNGQPIVGTGGGKHAELPDLLPDGITGSEANHITDAQLEFILDYVERRPVRPINLSPVDGEMEIGRQPSFEATSYMHPFNVDMYAAQWVIEGGGGVVFDSGEMESTSSIFLAPDGAVSEGINYKWRVRYQGENLQWSDWSEPTSFRTEDIFDSSEILRPIIFIPQQGQMQSSLTATVVTSAFKSIGSLIQSNSEFQLSSTPAFDEILDSGIGLNTWSGTEIITRGMPYFVRARHNATTGEQSRWSAVRMFSARELYSDSRIGLVLNDPDAWECIRVGRDYNRVFVDANYWKEHIIYSTLEASWNNGASTVIDGQHMICLRSFWVKSGICPSGPYAGKRMWLIDPSEPTEAEKNDGWHLHNAFINRSIGRVDSVFISAYRLDPTAGSTPTGTPHNYVSLQNIKNAITAYRNTNSGNPLKSGWEPMSYVHFEALKLLMHIEFGSLSDARLKMLESGGVYRNIPILTGGTSPSTGVIYNGLRYNSALDPVSGNTISIDPLFNYNDKKVVLLRSSLTDNPTLRFDDYMIGSSKTGAGEDSAWSTKLPYSRFYIAASGWESHEVHFSFAGSGIFGFQQVYSSAHNRYQAMMVKHDN